MSSSPRPSKGRAAIFAAMLAVTGVLIGFLAGAASATPATFNTGLVIQPIGIAYHPGELLVTSPWCGNPREVLSINSSGAVSVFRTLPPIFAGCREDYIAVSPANAAGFPANRVFVAQGMTILDATPTTPVTFTTIPDFACTDHTSITFDTVGLFSSAFPGHSMLVTCQNGDVWAVDWPSGGSIFVGSFGVFVEGPAVANAPSWASTPAGNLQGQLFVASETTNTVRAMDTLGGVTILPVTWPAAEGVRFVPFRNGSAAPCSFGSQEFFTNIFAFSGSGSVTGYPASEGDFAGLNGWALVPSEDPAIGIGAINPATLSIVPLSAPSFGQHEGSTFVDHSPGCQ